MLSIVIKYVALRLHTAESSAQLVQPTSSPSSPQPPAPFHELTIPYLRARAYQSFLGEQHLLQKYSTHTSYLTHYTSDGLRINALLTIPNGVAPQAGWPALVFVHGYIPPTLYKTTERYVEYVNALARNGFVVLKIDLRGHGSSEGEATGAYYSSEYVIDTLNAVAALKAASFVNARAIGLWGHSMSGNVVLRSAVVQRDIPAIAIWAGAGYSYKDLQEFGLNDNSYRPPSSSSPSRNRRQQLFQAYGPFDENSTFWQRVVPTRYLNDVQSAFQLPTDKSRARNSNRIKLFIRRSIRFRARLAVNTH
jgi:pimeloyl-ACP methyl ester carboxylesterase